MELLTLIFIFFDAITLLSGIGILICFPIVIAIMLLDLFISLSPYLLIGYLIYRLIKKKSQNNQVEIIEPQFLNDTRDVKEYIDVNEYRTVEDMTEEPITSWQRNDNGYTFNPESYSFNKSSSIVDDFLNSTNNPISEYMNNSNIKENTIESIAEELEMNINLDSFPM